MGFFDKLKESLTKTRKSFIDKVEAVFVDRNIDDTTLEELEEILIMSDVGTQASAEIMKEYSMVLIITPSEAAEITYEGEYGFSYMKVAKPEAEV